MLIYKCGCAKILRKGDKYSMRIYKSVRLASVTSVWADELISLKQQQLDKELQDGLLEHAENKLLKDFPFLNGISRNITFKVSFSSVVELCYRITEDYENDDWETLIKQMEQFNDTSDNNTSNTPKLYLEESVWHGLESYQRSLMSEDNKRILRLSYIIKLVLFAGWKEYKESL